MLLLGTIMKVCIMAATLGNNFYNYITRKLQICLLQWNLLLLLFYNCVYYLSIEAHTVSTVINAKS